MYDDSQQQSVLQEEIQLREEYHRLSMVAEKKVLFFVFIAVIGIGAIACWSKGQSNEAAYCGLFAAAVFALFKYAENRSKKIKAYLDEHYPII